jgi:hypothetical protein
VGLSDIANIRILDTLNYYKYRAAKSCQSAAESKNNLVLSFLPPHKGAWHVVVDLVGQGHEVRAVVDVLEVDSKQL